MSNNSVPSGDLAEVNSIYLKEIEEVLFNGALIGGKYVEKFESNLASYLNADHVISTASGMDALILALTSLDLPKKSNVLVVNNGGGYASLAVVSAGLNPIFADIESDGYLLCLNDLTKWSDKVSAVVATHLYGKMLNMEKLIDWAKAQDIYVIEDCAQAIGAEQQGKKSGTFGDIGCFSFYPTKNLGGIGDGGAVTTSNSQLAAKIRKLANYGWNGRYNIEVLNGRNSRLDAINAVVLNKKLEQLDSENQKRREILSKYIEALKPFSVMLDRSLDKSHVAHLATGQVDNVRSLVDFCGERGIQITRHYPILDSDQNGLCASKESVDTPKARNHCEKVVNLPIYPNLKVDQQESVISAVVEWCKLSVK